MRLRTPLRSAPTRASRRLVAPLAFVAAMLLRPPVLDAQAHDHAAHAEPMRDARLDLLLGGPHVILYHRGYLALAAEQIAGLQQLRRAVCEAEQAYVQHTEQWREGLSDLLGDSASLALRPSLDTPASARLHDVMTARARAESVWLTVLMQTRRDALALLTPSQRAQLSALRDHWAREAMSMIAETTRPGQRGHPGMQIPIRVPGMVVGETTLLPYCEVLHGPSSHISIPPPG
jgi:Spy/CpxP family protein refolding chaperone